MRSWAWRSGYWLPPAKLISSVEKGVLSIRSHHLADLVDNAVTEHRHHWKERTKGLTAGEIMTADITTSAPDEPVAIVSRRMLKQDLRTLPVTQDRRLVGILFRHDLLRLFDRPDPDVRSGVAAVLDNPLWTPEGHRVQATVIDGVVTLTGSVRDQCDIGLVCSVIRQVPGVIEVVNRLSVQSISRRTPARRRSRLRLISKRS